MPYTFMPCTHSQGHTLKSWCWHVACTWPNFIAPVCPLWLSVLCVEVLCEQLGWRLQAPEPSHLISPGWPWSLQSWGNTIHKEPLIWAGPLCIVLLIKHHRVSLTVFQNPSRILDNNSGSKEWVTKGFCHLNLSVICLIRPNSHSSKWNYT